MAGFVKWERAAALSGILESAAAVVGLGYWYMHAMIPMVGGGMDLAVNGKLGPGVTEHQIGGAALFVFVSQPLTWILLYFFFEGAVRFCGATFTESVMGTLPLCVLETAVLLTRNREGAKPGEAARKNAESLVASVRERLLLTRLKDIPDELHHSKSALEEMLEIWASRRKLDWAPPRIVRVDDLYYRLEGVAVEKGIRPFRYRLKRLPAGVPSRTMVLYKSGEALVKKE